MTVMVDIYEPEEVEAILKQVVPTIRMSLNHSEDGYGDYLWFACDGHRIQIERKQVGEILSDLDAVEEQLGREINNGVEETILLIEGVLAPVPGNSRATHIYIKPKSSNRDLLVGGKILRIIDEAGSGKSLCVFNGNNLTLTVNSFIISFIKFSR